MKRKKHMPEGDGVVWSSQYGKMCPRCSRPVAGCVCARVAAAQAGSDGGGVVRVGRETQGRKGSGVSVVTGVPLAGAELKALAKLLKQRCGSGGTLKDGVIEIQGDHRDLLVRLLEERGWTVKRSGG